MLGGKWDASLKKIIGGEEICEIMMQVSGDRKSEVNIHSLTMIRQFL